MNIVPSTASLSSTAAPRADGSANGLGSADPTAASDGAATGGASSTKGFGSMLSRHLDDGRIDASTRATASRGRGDDAKLQGTDAGAGEPSDPATSVVAADPSAAASDATSGAGVPQDLFPTLAATPKPATSGTSAATNGSTSRKSESDDERTRDGDAGSDLAAQLALASQWIGAAKPVDPAGAPSQPTSTAATAPAIAAGSFDVKAAPGKDRAAAARDDAIRGRTVAQSHQTTSGTPFTAASGDTPSGDGRQNDRGDAPAGNSSIVAAKDDAKTRDALATAALDAATAAVAGTPVHATTTPDGDAFGLRLAAQVSDVQTTVTTPTAVAGSSTTTDVVREPVGSPAWSHEVGQATLRMAANDLQSASIRLNPEHLGPLDVQVRVDNGVAHLAFNATHVDTRQALEASRGTLDQLFANQGLKMGDVSVGSGSGNGSNDASAMRDQAADASRRDGGNRWSGADAGNDGDAIVKTVTTRIAQASGLVDTFA